jgi:hypothetical protein
MSKWIPAFAGMTRWCRNDKMARNDKMVQEWCGNDRLGAR